MCMHPDRTLIYAPWENVHVPESHLGHASQTCEFPLALQQRGIIAVPGHQHILPNLVNAKHQDNNKKWEKVASENWCVYEQGIKSIPQMHTPSNFFWHQFWFMRAGHFAFIWNICLHFYISKTRFDAEQTPVPLLDLYVSLHITLGRKQWLKSYFLTSFYPDYAFCYSSE